MKTRSLFLVLITLAFYTGCTDRLAGPALDSQAEVTPHEESSARKAGSRELADLSVQMRVDTATPPYNDTLFITVNVHNDGPDLTTGVAVLFKPPTDSLFLKFDTSTSAGSTCCINDTLLVWTLGEMPSGATEQLRIAGRIVGTGRATSTAEIIASDVRDPDSTPGDGDPRQDDYDSATIFVRRGQLP